MLARMPRENANFFIEGTIAAGKSSVIKYLQEHYPEILFMTEPVVSWTKPFNYLGAFYEANEGKLKEDATFALQVKILVTLMQRAHTASRSENRVKVFERSLKACKVFVSLSDMSPSDSRVKALDDLAEFGIAQFERGGKHILLDVSLLR